MVKRAKPGDVLEVEVPEGRIYLQFLGTHPEYGDGVAVRPTPSPAPAQVDEALFENSYILFYPARAAVNRGLANVVGWLPCGGIPRRLRRPGVRVGRRIETWVIEEGSQEETKRQLSEEELQLPLAVIWNHELLVQRVTEGWRPEHEGRAESGE